MMSGMKFDPDTLELVKVATPIAFGVSTIFFAAIATVLGFGQWWVARHKLKLDLYDRRFKVYHAVRETFSKAIWDDLQPGDIADFQVKTAEARFLFGFEVRMYLDDIAKQFKKHRQLTRRLDSKLPIGDERTELAERDANLTKFFQDELDRCVKVFAPYLMFDRVL